VFYKIEGWLRAGGEPTACAVVFENQLAGAVAGMLERDDVKTVTVSNATERDFMEYQRRRQRERARK
jgi:molybdopterin biosynthesis enzyme